MEPVVVYQATYSGVPVYELNCNGVAVMRRKADAYMNATQILKVANFDKPHRTRILEREVQTGHHEKIQGGYGKYQGTWVPLERAIALAQQYGVEQPLQPIFTFVRGEKSPPPAPRHTTAPSNKPKKARDLLPKKRKKNNNNDSGSVPGSPRRPYRRAADGVAALTAQFASTDDDMDELEGSQPGTPTGRGRGRRGRPKRVPDDDESLGSPRRMMALSPDHDDGSGFRSGAGGGGGMMRQRSRRELEQERIYAQKLLTHFLSNSDEIPALLRKPPRDLDINVIIDDEGHTPLHWAAVMGRLQVVSRLIQLGVDLYRVNYRGETALMRSVMYTNNYDQKCFDRLAELLGPTSFNIDKCDQTVFHHVAKTANSKGKLHALRYYMEILIDRMSHNRSELISILNVQDVNGDTALTIAARYGNKRLVRLLMNAGASAELANEEGMTAQDYIGDTAEATRRGSKQEEDEDDDDDEPATPLTVHEREKRLRSSLHRRIDVIYRAMSNTAVAPAAQPARSMSQSFDDLANSYERDLQQLDAELTDKQRVIHVAHQQLHAMRNAIQQDDAFANEKAKSMRETDDQRHARAKEYEQLLKFIQYTKLTHAIKENEQEHANAAAKLSPPPASSTRHAAPSGPDDTDTLTQQLHDLQTTRQQLVRDILAAKTSLPEKRIQNYKHLISKCCNIDYDNVDKMLQPLLASFDEAAALQRAEIAQKEDNDEKIKTEAVKSADATPAAVNGAPPQAPQPPPPQDAMDVDPPAKDQITKEEHIQA
ncbi:hypothetical protein BC940DRAFT_371964 [Gongronella butleri]|nr:hypothetical protein BC940DRAFT_371964 [Gongronella butleri]